MAQYDPIAIKSGILTVLGTDTLRADRIAAAGLTVTGLVTGDVCQVSGALTLAKAVNTSTSPIVGIYDGETNSVVRKGVVVATMKAGVTLANGDTVWLSSTAGALTNVKPTKDMLHEVGVVVDAANSKILLQQKPVIALPPSPPMRIYMFSNQKIFELDWPTGDPLRTVNIGQAGECMIFDGEYIWVNDNANPTRIVKVDPVTMTVVGGPYYHGFATSDRGTAFDGTNLWILDRNNKCARCFDRNGDFVRNSVNIWDGTWFPSEGLSYDGNGYLWSMVSNGGAQVNKISVADGTLTKTWTPSPNPTGRSHAGPAVYGDYVYFLTVSGTTHYVTRVHRTTLASINVAVAGAYWGSIVTDGTYLYLTGSSTSVIKKLRISDLGEEWNVSSEGTGDLHCDCRGYIWDHHYNQYNMTRVTAVDGTRYVRSGLDSTHGPGICSTGYVLPVS